LRQPLRTRLGRLACALGALALCVPALSLHALAQSVPIPPSPTQWVTDTVGILSPETRDNLNQRLRKYERATGHQILVWIGSSTGDTPLEQWTIAAFTKWKVGRKGIDDGAILFLFTQDRRVRIEVGYGLEGTLTDAVSSEIIRHDIEPKMRANDPDGAVSAAVSDILSVIGGENGASPQPITQAPGAQGTERFVPWFFLLWFGIIFIIVILSARRRGPYIIGSPWVGSGWGGGFGGGGGGFGGGFSGGGGMGGGGGASGGW
jgi:uncharacterized protein